MDPQEFEQLVRESIDSLPEVFLDYLDNVEIIVEARPSREQRRALDIKPGETVYGVYEGIPLTERSGDMFAPPRYDCDLP
jgi:predicted Zn-dependent protease with MMP-like domain